MNNIVSLISTNGQVIYLNTKYTQSSILSNISLYEIGILVLLTIIAIAVGSLVVLTIIKNKKSSNKKQAKIEKLQKEVEQLKQATLSNPTHYGHQLAYAQKSIKLQKLIKKGGNK